jgi:hypothetical protein
LKLAGPRIDAHVVDGSRVVKGSISGLGGGVASDVLLTLIGSGTFAFDNFLATTADVNIIGGGTLSISNANIGDRATFDNAETVALLDQHNMSMQQADIQFYSEGKPFSMQLRGNSLITSATVLYHGSDYEAFSLTGTGPSVLEQSEEALTWVNLALPNLYEDEDATEPSEELISFTGTPISYEPRSDRETAK